MKTILASIILITFVSSGLLAGEPAVDLYRGDLEGSKILVIAPKKWNKNLLILAHGHRDAKEELDADFPHTSMFYQVLLKEGWMIASTSYRRNGFILDDAIDDLKHLRQFVIAKYGKPDRTLMKGWSMGGMISLLIAERHPDRADGILSECHPAPKQVGYTRKPVIPTLLFTNQDEAAGLREYVADLKEGAARPGLWIVKREGHCNFNDDETLTAFREMVKLSEGKPIAYSREFLIEKEERTSVAIIKDGRAYAKVTGFSPSYGNIYTEFTRSDLEGLGVKKGDMFRVGYLDKEFPVKLGADYRDVPRGDWVAFFDAREQNLLKISRSFANAAETLGCTKGVRIYLSK